MIKRYRDTYKCYFTNRRFVASVIVALLLLLAGLFISFHAGQYATDRASNWVNDIVLDNIPVFNVDLIFVYGPLVMWLYVIFLCLQEPRRIPFILKNIAVFVLVRSIFITLTHIGPFPDHLVITDSAFSKNFTFGGDLFFSGHTGLPFLLALIFHTNIRLRTLFTILAVFFGIIVLMAHRHYTIDVLSAFFITYTIYHICKYLFKEDERTFYDGLKEKEV